VNALPREAGLAGDPGGGDALVVGSEDRRVALDDRRLERPLKLTGPFRRLSHPLEKGCHPAKPEPSHGHHACQNTYLAADLTGATSGQLPKSIDEERASGVLGLSFFLG
jgi:hypothetical protein